MRKEPEFFKDQEIELVYIAKKLREALALEELLTSANVDYLVETDQYFGGFIFQRVRIGAFFYVRPEAAEPARLLMRLNGYKPQGASV
jgi:hypothetical protein